MADKTKIGLIVSVIIIAVIGIIIAFNIIGDTSTDLTDAADSVTQANNCSQGNDAAGIPFVYNATDADCYNSSTTSVTPSTSNALPLSSLFGSSGVLLVVLMAFLFIALVIWIVVKSKFGN